MPWKARIQCVGHEFRRAKSPRPIPNRMNNQIRYSCFDSFSFSRMFIVVFDFDFVVRQWPRPQPHAFNRLLFIFSSSFRWGRRNVLCMQFSVYLVECRWPVHGCMQTKYIFVCCRFVASCISCAVCTLSAVHPYAPLLALSEMFIAIETFTC